MIIDAHTHIFPPHMRRDRAVLISLDPGFGGIYENEKAKMITAEDLVAMLDRESIDKAVTFGFPWQDIELCRQGNDYVLESMAKFPDRLIGFIAVPWGSTEPVLRECERGLAAGAKGVGELALYHEPLNHESVKHVYPLAQMLGQKRLPLLLHVNEPVGHEYSGKAVIDFKSLQGFIAAHPNLILILAHWGGGFFFFELMPEIRKITKNVYYDTAASPFLYHHQIYEIALNIVGEDRILFGSDYPLILPSRYCKGMHLSVPSGTAREKMQGANAERLFML